MNMNNDISPELQKRLKDAKQLAANSLLRQNYFANIVGVGIGVKSVDGAATPTNCVRVYVVSKVDLEDLSPAEVIPSSFLDVPTDVIPVGHFGQTGARPFHSCERCGKTYKDTGQWSEHRTVACRLPSLSKNARSTLHLPGSKISVDTYSPNVNRSAVGTLGAVVTDEDGTQYILGCNHTLAVNGRVPEDSVIVSAEFVGRGTSLATRDAFIELKADAPNTADCALAKLILKPKKTVGPAFPGDTYRLRSGAPAAAELGMKVQKVGGATGHTLGTVVDKDADLYVTFSFGTFRFENQVMIDGGADNVFADPGDSGSMVADSGDKPKARAMIYAASGQFAVACPLEDALNKQLLGRKLTLVV
jgi:hypothetical protein